MKVRRMRKGATELGTSSDSSSWVSKGEGFGYLPKRFTDPNYPQTNREEGQKEDDPHDEINDNATPDDYDSANKSMLRRSTHSQQHKIWTRSLLSVM